MINLKIEIIKMLSITLSTRDIGKNEVIISTIIFVFILLALILNKNKIFPKKFKIIMKK